jgi:hypothetical protein
MEGAPDGCGDLGARELIGIDQQATPTCSQVQRLGKGRAEGDARPVGAQSTDADARHRDSRRNGSVQLAASERAPEPADGGRPGHTVDGEAGAVLVADDYGARARAEEPIDRANGESAADQKVLERSDIPPEPAPAEQPATEAVAGKPAEGRTRAGAGIAVDDQSLASLKPPDRRLRLGTEDSVNPSAIGPTDA